MLLADCFAERSLRGMLTRMVGALGCSSGYLFIAARLWWSVTGAAIVVFVVHP